MNTEQKAREWLATGTFDDNDLLKAEEIITALLADLEEAKDSLKYCEEDWDRVTVALGLTVHSDPDDLVEKATKLLAERGALLDALGYYMSQFGQGLEAHGIQYGEHQKLADEKARQAIAMCEEQNNE